MKTLWYHFKLASMGLGYVIAQILLVVSLVLLTGGEVNSFCLLFGFGVLIWSLSNDLRRTIFSEKRK